eukprot:8085974-Pyramimonas_sp.AAC.1
MIGRRRPHGSGTPPGSSVRHSPQRHGSREAGQGQRSHCSPPGQVDDTEVHNKQCLWWRPLTSTQEGVMNSSRKVSVFIGAGNLVTSSPGIGGRAVTEVGA